MNDLAQAQRKPPAARHRTFSPGKKKNKTMWITSDANYFVDAKSHAREKPLVTGHQSIPYDLITKDIFGIIKWKSPLDRHSKGTKGFIIWVQKLDDVVWSDASWDVGNFPFAFRVRFTCIVRLGRFPYNSNIYYACSNFILFRTNSLK